MWWGNTPKSRSTEILIIRQRCAPHFTIVSSSETLGVSFLPLSGLAFQILHSSKVCEGTLLMQASQQGIWKCSTLGLSPLSSLVQADIDVQGRSWLQFTSKQADRPTLVSPLCTVCQLQLFSYFPVFCSNGTAMLLPDISR